MSDGPRSWFRALGWKRLFAVLAGLLILWWVVGKVRPPAVDVVPVEKRLLVQSVVATGRVRSLSLARLGPAASGTVARVLVREGDAVRAGQLLLELDGAEARAQLAQAVANLSLAEASLSGVSELRTRVTRSTLKSAQVAYEKAQSDFQRVRRLVEAGATASDQLDLARQTLEAATSQRDIAAAQQDASQAGGSDRRGADAGLAQARAAVQLAQARVANTRIVAPGDGRVLTRDAEPGDAVQAGRVLLTVALAGRTQLVAVPDEKDVARLAEGQAAVASADAFPGKTFPARVSYVAPGIDPDQGTIEVRLDVDSPPPYLRPDMTVSLQIETARRAAATVVQIGAVRDPDTPTPWVTVIRDGRVTRQAVTLGLRSEGASEVLSGLAVGDMVIVPGKGEPPVGARARARGARGG